MATPQIIDLPASVEAEHRLVAAVFIDDGYTLAQCLARRLAPTDFSNPPASEAYGLACDLYRDRRPITAEAAAELLHARGKGNARLDQISEILCAVSTTTQAADDLKTVLDYSALREAIKSATRAVEVGMKPSATPAERLDALMPHLRRAQEAGSPVEVRDLAAMSDNAAKRLESPAAPGLPGPFPSWDRQAGALRPGELAVLAARPGCGKTALALQHAGAAIHQRATCAMFSLEMPGEDLCVRMAHQALGAHADHRELAAWIRAHLRQEKLLKIYDGSAGASIEQIEARSRLLAASPAELGLVVVDYLQLVAPPIEAKREHRERQVAAISRALKLLAMELRVPVLLLAQLNREVEKEDRLPRLSDLRESGAIEQDADAVWFLHPDTSGPQISDAERRNIFLIQAKRRNGPQGLQMSLEFNCAAVRFTPQVQVTERI